MQFHNDKKKIQKKFEDIYFQRTIQIIFYKNSIGEKNCDKFNKIFF